jgi:alpha-tubulin suppressor-like RCC1 family protein
MSKALNFVAIFCATVLVTACGGGAQTSGQGEQLLASTTVVGPDAGDGVRIAAGAGHSVGLSTNGTVYAWGANGNGQVSGNNPYYQYTPVAVRGLSAVRAVKAGYAHTLAMKADGTVWAWGNNTSGELGHGYAMQSSTPLQVTGLSRVVAIAAGQTNSVALTSNGTVWGWGSLDGVHRQAPAPVPGLSGVAGLSGVVVTIAAAGQHVYALKSDGTVWGWGNNWAGSLGNGSTVNSYNAAVKVVGLDHVTAISASFGHAMALKSDGTVWTWGYNGSGELGVAGLAESHIPVQVPGLSGVKAIAAASGNSAAIHTDGTVSVWGKNSTGQLGNGFPDYMPHYAPVLIPGVHNAVAMSMGQDFTIILGSDGSVHGLGMNYLGELGTGTSDIRYTLVQTVGVYGRAYLDLGKSTAH